MECPECHTENPESRKFCRECGNKLILVCPECSTENIPVDKYCGECGYKLKPEVEDRIEDQPSRPSTSGTTINNVPIDGERKHVTVLFSDLSGYTAMSERLDPEEVKDITLNIFNRVAKIVRKYDGFIEKYAGDAVMALFGASETHEDDPVRAIKAAMEIHSLVNSLSPQYEKKIDQSLKMHTGINTGLVVTGNINLEKGTHGVLGDTLNTASRLSGIGNADDILVGKNTYSQSEGFFNFNKLEPTIIKGKTEPIEAYRVLSAKGIPIKIHRFNGLRADLVGRKVELNQLASSLHNLIEEHKGSVATICGSAGTGKSRLVEELRSIINSNNVQWFEGHAYPYSQNIPYSPIINLLSTALGIDESDSLNDVKDKIDTGISELIGENKDFIPYIGSLFSISYPELEEVSPENWKERLHKAIQTVLLYLSKTGPSIVCFEDLHWADPSFLELIRDLLPGFNQPILFICTYRPVISLFTTHQIDSMTVSYHEILLKDLSISESQTMVESLLETITIPPELQRIIHNKIGGNPFYIEELVNSLIESDTLVKDNEGWQVKGKISRSDISSTIHGVISGRVDKLEKESKRILQEASVIGRTFLFDILNRITLINKDIDRSIRSLEQLDLIRVRSFEPDLEYLFKHALTQEVVYSSLLKKDRQVIHEQIGIVIEDLFSKRLPEFYEILAYHFKESRLIHKAVHYLSMAGDKNFKKSAMKEANSSFQRAFNMLSDKTNKTNEDNKLLINLLIRWALVLRWGAKFQTMANLFKPYLYVVESINDLTQIGKYYACYGYSLCMTGKPKQSYNYLTKAIKLCREAQDIEYIGYSCAWMAFTCMELGLLDEAVKYGEIGEEMSKKREWDLILFSETLSFLGLARQARGEIEHCKRIALSLIEKGTEHADYRLTSIGTFQLGTADFIAGDFNSALDRYNKAIKTTKDPIMSITILIWTGWAYVSSNQVMEAERTLKKLTSFTGNINEISVKEAIDGLLSIALLSKGELSRGMKRIKDLQRYHLEAGLRYRYAVFEYLQGRFYLQVVQKSGPKNLSVIAKNTWFLIKNIPFADKIAEKKFKRAIEIAKKIGSNYIIGQSYLYLGILHYEKKRNMLAKECISEAIRVFEIYGLKMYLQQAEEALKAL